MATGTSRVMGLFPRDAQVDSIFYKLLTANDDSGRHGVLIPVDAYEFFPPIPAFDPDAAQNYLVPITTVWRDGEEWVERDSNFAHYHRYPERRITSLYPPAVNVVDPVRLLVVGRDGAGRYFAAVLTPGQEAFEAAVAELAIPAASWSPGGAQGIIAPADLRVAGTSTVFDRLLDLLVEVAAKGYVPTMRAGDTGVGYTLETLLEIDANVRMDADFHGIELKSSRSRDPVDRRPAAREHVTLFAKTPVWEPVGSRENLLNRHGYYDENGRWGLYTSIYAGHPNRLGWSLSRQDQAERLTADRGGLPQVYWSYPVLAKRLREKHTETVFVTAHAVRRDGIEQFHYDEILHCKGASLANLLGLIDERGVFHDFAMHRLPNGTARDHGFLFRTTMNNVPRLFTTVEGRRLF